MLMAKTTFNYSQGDVVDFKLMSGEELISRIIEDRTDTYVLNKPMALLNTPNGGLGMMPIPIAGNYGDPVLLNKHAVAIHTKCEPELASQYMEKTTGLLTSGKGII
jgi:hypothetical protein